MERCHYTYDKETGKRVLIPGCMGVAVHYGDKNPLLWCTCKADKPTAEDRIEILEKKVALLEKQLKELKRDKNESSN